MDVALKKNSQRNDPIRMLSVYHLWHLRYSFICVLSAIFWINFKRTFFQFAQIWKIKKTFNGRNFLQGAYIRLGKPVRKGKQIKNNKIRTNAVFKLPWWLIVEEILSLQVQIVALLVIVRTAWPTGSTTTTRRRRSGGGSWEGSWVWGAGWWITETPSISAETEPGKLWRCR